VDEPDFVGPRTHHYEFAHRVLPRLMFDNPGALLSLAEAGEAGEALRDMWQELGEQLAPDDRVAPDGLEVHGWNLGDHLAVVVTLPPPRRSAEAYFVAATVRELRQDHPGARSRQPDIGDPKVRVFTLEHHNLLEWASGRVGEAGASAVSTMFCEWTGDGRHINFGAVPAPSIGDFVAILATKLGC